MKKFLILVSLFTFLIVGCRKTENLISFHYFDKDIWKRFDFVQFSFNIKDTETEWDVWIIVEHTPAFEGRSLPLSIEMITPAGDSRILDLEAYLRSTKDGNYLGEAKEDYYVVKTLSFQGIRFNEKGICKFEIENYNHKYYTQGVKTLGIEFKRAE